MPPASTEVKEAIDDFERFSRRNAWERALKALYTIPEDQAARFVDGDNGFIIPVARKRRLALDRAARRRARRPIGCSTTPRRRSSSTKPRARPSSRTSSAIYSAYFITAVGDNAADRLGDLYFELGRFDRAADCWLAILRERPDTDLSPALLSVKAALALHRAGRRAEFEQIKAELADRYSDEKADPGRTDRAAGRAAALRSMSDEARRPAPDQRSRPRNASTAARSRRRRSTRPGNCGSPNRSKPA